MYEIRIEDTFAAAHFITDYHGKCENLHGHNYKVRVHASGKVLGKGGMLLDFGILKNGLKKVLKILDHTNLNDHSVFSHGNPSAELIAEFIYMELKKDVSDAPIIRVEV